MADRVSEFILLCEDDPQEQLVRRYLVRCGVPEPTLRVKNASREVSGGNVGWVLREFPKELEACRKRHVVHAKTMLIVVVDADGYTTADRRAHLAATTATDPVVVLIPKRHIETWIRYALGQAVNEDANYKKPALKKADVRTAAAQIYGWARGNPPPNANCPESLQTSLDAFRQIC